MSKENAILYVDDEPLNLQLFEINLHYIYQVYTALSANDGMDILKNNPAICVVVSDMKMPVMNGLEFIVHAKKLRPDICYFILTGYDITPDIQQAIDSKTIVKYFQKPFDLKDIVSSIDQSLEKRK